MPRALKVFAIPALMLIVGLVAGAALGQRQGFGMGKTFLESEVPGTLAVHVEVASSIRVGDTDRALALLDSIIDSAVVNLQARPEPHRASPAMSQAKVYRRAIPAVGPNAALVVAALANVPEPEQLTARLATLAAQSAK
jgi:hypothetical protein